MRDMLPHNFVRATTTALMVVFIGQQTACHTSTAALDAANTAAGVMKGARQAEERDLLQNLALARTGHKILLFNLKPGNAESIARAKVDFGSENRFADEVSDSVVIDTNDNDLNAGFEFESTGKAMLTPEVVRDKYLYDLVVAFANDDGKFKDYAKGDTIPDDWWTYRPSGLEFTTIKGAFIVNGPEFTKLATAITTGEKRPASPTNATVLDATGRDDTNLAYATFKVKVAPGLPSHNGGTAKVTIDLGGAKMREVPLILHAPDAPKADLAGAGVSQVLGVRTIDLFDPKGGDPYSASEVDNRLELVTAALNSAETTLGLSLTAPLRDDPAAGKLIQETLEAIKSNAK